MTLFSDSENTQQRKCAHVGVATIVCWQGSVAVRVATSKLLN